MSDKNAKAIRSQVRNVVKEILEEVLAKEMIMKIEQDLRMEQKSRLDQVFEMVKGTLQRIDDRQKDIQSLIMREMTKATQDPNKQD